MRVEVVHHKNDFFHVRVYGISKMFYLFHPVSGSPAFPDAGVMPPGKWFYESKDAACAITDIFLKNGDVRYNCTIMNLSDNFQATIQ